MQPATQDNPQPDAPTKVKRSGSLGQRWLTAGVAMPLVLLFVWFGGWWAFAATFLVMALCAFELHNMAFHAGYRSIIAIMLGLSIMFMVSAMFPVQRLIILEVGLGATILISLPWLFFRKNLEGALVDWALTLALSIYLGIPASFFLLLRGYTPAQIHAPGGALIYLPPGAWWLLVVLLGVWGFDSAAFFAGRYFGRHKLSPRVSPGKTWEGVIGGMVLSIAAGLLFTVVPLGVPWYLAIVLGILLGAAAVLGDLSESLIKRQTHVKDSGQFMPGHGGMLDRVDSLWFAVIVVYIFAQFIGKL